MTYLVYKVNPTYRSPDEGERKAFEAYTAYKAKWASDGAKRWTETRRLARAAARAAYGRADAKTRDRG